MTGIVVRDHNGNTLLRDEQELWDGSLEEYGGGSIQLSDNGETVIVTLTVLERENDPAEERMGP